MQNFKANEHYVAHHKLDKIELHPYIRVRANSVELPHNMIRKQLTTYHRP